MTIDIDAVRQEWLRHCGLCDAGLLTECTCPKGDVRALISTLCDRVDELKAERDQFRNSAALFAITTSDLTRQFSSVHVLCEPYKDQPPPIFQGPGLSERGEGYNAGTRDMARAVLAALAGEAAEKAGAAR